MEYLKKKFSVSYNSKEYRNNWLRIFSNFDPLRDCKHVKKCAHVDGFLCDSNCEMVTWSEKEWEAQ